MFFPRRKQLRLKDYNYSHNGAYHITICTHNRQQLFQNIITSTKHGIAVNFPLEENSNFIEKRFSEIENKFPLAKIDCYTVMPDHVHFIVFITDDHANSLANSSPTQSIDDVDTIIKRNKELIPLIVNWFKTMTTNEYIRLVKNGTFPPFQKHVWQRSYNDRIIRNSEDLRETREYIEKNPYKLSHYLTQK